MSGFSVVSDWIYLGLVLVILVGLAWPFGAFMARVFTDQRTMLTPVVRPVERAFYRLAGVDARREMRWTTYAYAVLASSTCSASWPVYALQRHAEARCR